MYRGRISEGVLIILLRLVLFRTACRVTGDGCFDAAMGGQMRWRSDGIHRDVDVDYHAKEVNVLESEGSLCLGESEVR